MNGFTLIVTEWIEPTLRDLSLMPALRATPAYLAEMRALWLARCENGEQRHNGPPRP